MKKFLFIATLSSFFSIQSFGATVSGRVVDSCSGQPVEGAGVSVNEYAQGVTDATGEFKVKSSSIKKGDSVLIKISNIGYLQKIINLDKVKLPTDKAVLDISSEIEIVKSEGEVIRYSVLP